MFHSFKNWLHSKQAEVSFCIIKINLSNNCEASVLGGHTLKKTPQDKYTVKIDICRQRGHILINTRKLYIA